MLFHAAAGGVGLICQWAKQKGVRLIGTASTQAKCDLAGSRGAEVCLLSDDPELSNKLRTYAPDGFPVVYDSVGRSSYRLSLGYLRLWGHSSVLAMHQAPLMLSFPGSWLCPDRSFTVQP